MFETEKRCLCCWTEAAFRQAGGGGGREAEQRHFGVNKLRRGHIFLSIDGPTTRPLPVRVHTLQPTITHTHSSLKGARLLSQTPLLPAGVGPVGDQEVMNRWNLKWTQIRLDALPSLCASFVNPPLPAYLSFVRAFWKWSQERLRGVQYKKRLFAPHVDWPR